MKYPDSLLFIVAVAAGEQQRSALGDYPTKDMLLAAAVLCAMRQRYRYKGYESAEKAMAALRRRCRGFASLQLEAALAQGSALYVRAEELVWVNRHLQADKLDELVPALQAEFPAADVGVARNALTWAHYWRVLR